MILEGKNAVVTGASSGIGMEMVERLLKCGCKVVAAARTMTKTGITSPTLYKIDLDVSDKAGVDKLFDFAVEKMGGIDLFVANAGFGFYEKLDEPDWEHFLKIFNVNVFSMMYSAEKLKKLNGDKPFNFLGTASGMSYFSLPGYSMYSSTKAAVRGFADSYRFELKKGQHMQLVYPIATITKFFENAGGIPMAWPQQTAAHVADTMIKGLIKDKPHIHPSKQFKFFQFLTAVFPPALKLYNRKPYKDYVEYLAKKGIQL